jgi:regulatory protein SWI6
VLIIPAMTNMLTQSLSQHKDLLRARTEQIDLLNAQIREISTSQLREQEAVQQLKDSVRLRGERLARAAKLRQTIAEKRSRQQASQESSASLDPPWLDLRARNIIMSEDAFEDEPNPSQRQLIATQLPSQQEMQVYVNAYRSHTASLQQQADELKARSGELEALYRKVVSLCTGVEEDKVEESLPALVQAVESEGTAIGAQEVGRVRDFLRRVDSGGDAMVES